MERVKRQMAEADKLDRERYKAILREKRLKRKQENSVSDNDVCYTYIYIGHHV